MPELVRGDALADARRSRVPTDELPKPLTGETAASRGDEEGTGDAASQEGGTGLCQVGADGLERSGAHRDEALLVAFAPGDEEARVGPQRLHRERHQYAHPKSGGV